jgi:hypothetical protein
MLFETDSYQLSFSFDNGGVPNTVYITTDESENKLVLTITSDVANTSFTPGELVPPNDADNARGSILYLDLSPLKLTTEEFNKVECKADNWDWASYAPAFICLTPKTDITLGNGPGDEINININKLTISKTPTTSGVSMSVSYYRVSPITLLDSLPLTSYFSVVVQAAPGGHENLHDAIACQLSTEPYICNSIPGYDPVSNNLSFILKAGPKPVTVNAGPATVFTVSMVYAHAAPGYGALTTPQKAIQDITVTHGQNASEWKITKDADLQNPCWRMVPPADKPLVGTGTKSTVQFNISNIITDFEPGPTILIVEYKDVPGYDAGSFSILLTKIQHVSIADVYVTPNPSYLDKKEESNVHVQWNVSDAGTMMLYPIAENVTGKSFIDTKIPQTTRFSLVAQGKLLSANGNVATKSVNALVLPKINCFSADPTYIYYKSFPTVVELAWNVNSPGKVSLVSTVTGRDPHSFNPVASVEINIAKPQMITLEPQGVKNALYMRNVVIAAFKAAVRTEGTAEVLLGEFVYMPSANVLFNVAYPANFLYTLDADTLKNVVEPIQVGVPISLALSPDASLLYVACLGEAAIRVFQIKQSADGKIAVTPFTSIGVGEIMPYSVAVSRSGNELYLLAINQGTSTIIIFSKSADNQFKQLQKFDTPAMCAQWAVSPWGDKIIASTIPFSNTDLFVYTRQGDGSFAFTLKLTPGFTAISPAITPNGEYFFICHLMFDKVSIVSTKTWAILDIVATHAKPHAIVFSASSDYAFIKCESGVTLMGYNRATERYRIVDMNIPIPAGNSSSPYISSSGNQVFISNGYDKSKLTTITMAGYEKGIGFTGLQIQPTSALAGATNVLVWQDVRIRPEPASTGAVAIQIANHQATTVLSGLTIYDITYSRDNTLLYVIQGQGETITVNVKDAGDYSDKGQVAGLAGTPAQLLVNTDGSLLFIALSSANGTKNSVAIVRTLDMQVAATIALQATAGVKLLPMVCLPDSSKIFIAQKESISILEHGAGGYTLSSKTITLADTLQSLAMFPDGSSLVGINSSGQTISLINATTYAMRPIRVPASFSTRMAGLAISPDGSNIALSANDKAAVLFVDTKTYSSIYAVATEQSPQYPVYLPDGSQLFVACQNGVGVIKQVQPA